MMTQPAEERTCAVPFHELVRQAADFLNEHATHRLTVDSGVTASCADCCHGLRYTLRQPSSPAPVDPPKNETTDERDDMILDLFTQACALSSGKYTHDFISTYERAQKYLIARGLIKAEDCIYE